MAVSCPNTVRVRVYFDYPPPALTDCRMCWVLVDLNKCRVVADLASIIRDKFDFSRRTLLNLFVEDCYLPPAESVYVVRDNDSIRVKVDVLPQVNGCEVGSDMEEATLNTLKRRRDGEEESADEEELMAKKRKKSTKRKENLVVRSAQAEEEMTTKKKKKKKRRKKKPETDRQGPTVMSGPQKGSVASTVKKDSPQAAPINCKAVNQKRAVSSSESSDDHEEEAPKTGVPSQLSGGGMAKTAKPVSRVSTVSTSDSDSDSSCTAALSRTKPPPGGCFVPASSRIPEKKAGGFSSDSSSEIQLVIKRPMQGVLSGPAPGLSSPTHPGPPGAGRGLGRGNMWPPHRQSGPRGGGRGGRGQRGPWRAGGQHNGPGNTSNTHNTQNGQQLEDTLTNRAVVLQNPPARDYTTMPLLAAPPAVGQTIAFKLLELTENYTPEVSDYKEGKIVGFDQSTNHIELELLSSNPAPLEPGKFDLVYQAPDGSEVIEYALSRGSQLTERWESLLEPRLVVGGPVDGGGERS